MGDGEKINIGGECLERVEQCVYLIRSINTHRQWK